MTSNDRQSAVRFYADRFCAAFPDVDVLPEITDKATARTRLNLFFAKPLTSGDAHWLGAMGWNTITSFSLSTTTPYEFLGLGGNGFLALDIDKVVPICQSNLDYTSCVYVESRGCVPCRDVELDWHGIESRPFHKCGRELSASERNSGYFFDGLTRTSFTGSETIELFYPLKRCNVLFCPQFGSVLMANRDNEIKEALSDILSGKKSVENLKKLLFGFLKPDYKYVPFTEEPLESDQTDPELLAALLRKIQQSR